MSNIQVLSVDKCQWRRFTRNLCSRDAALVISVLVCDEPGVFSSRQTHVENILVHKIGS